MLDLAIEIDTDEEDISIVNTNRGVELKAPEWPHDCEFQLVAFDLQGKCEVVWTEELTADIAEALKALDSATIFRRLKPDWYRRLKLYAAPGPPEGDAGC